jgi:hypothetical protein
MVALQPLCRGVFVAGDYAERLGIGLKAFLVDLDFRTLSVNVKSRLANGVSLFSFLSYKENKKGNDCQRYDEYCNVNL